MDKASALVVACTQAVRNGAGYSDVWDAILRQSELVVSPPIQHYDEELPHTDVLLNNGFWLRFCTNSQDFTLRRARLRRPF